MPLVLALLINIYREGRIRHYVGLFAIAYFFLGIPIWAEFIWAYLAIFIIIDAIRRKKVSIRLTGVLLIWIVMGVLQSLSVIMETLSRKGSRGQKVANTFVFDFMEFIECFLNYLRYGQYHSGTLQGNFLFPFITLVAVYILIQSLWRKRYRNLVTNPILLMYYTIIFNAFCQADSSKGIIFRTIQKTVPGTSAVEFGRFIEYSPLFIIVTLMYIGVWLYGHA